MKPENIENIIQGYISELHNARITQFSYSGGILYLYRDGLTEEEYTLVDFISNLIIIKLSVVDGEDVYDIRKRIQRIENEYEDEIISFYPLSCAIDSLYMQFEQV